jgi:sugar O-acyltransferase (sialic acid O-acetyltransferase NeuD family)
MKIAIIGAAELGKLIARHSESDQGHTVVGFYDDFNFAKFHDNYPILGTLETIIEDYKNNVFDAIIIGIGYKRMKDRSSIFTSLKGKIPFVNIIHSSAYIDSTCSLGEGVFILPGVTVDVGVTIGDNVLINAGSIIAHHTSIGDNSFIAPGVHIAGLVTIEESCFIGIGSIIKDSICIKKMSIVGAGSLVLNDTEENSISIGAPAKIIKYTPQE